LGRRKRRVIKIVKKRLPIIFDCPSCGAEAIKVTILKNSNGARIHCGSCGLKDEFEIYSSAKLIDVYCKFTDRYFSKPVEES